LGNTLDRVATPSKTADREGAVIEKAATDGKLGKYRNSVDRWRRIPFLRITRRLVSVRLELQR
jgi:hypothetical protein